jgi:hypothetical protein
LQSGKLFDPANKEWIGGENSPIAAYHRRENGDSV